MLVSWVYIQTTEKISFNIIIITVNYHCLLHCTYWEKVQERLADCRGHLWPFENGSIAMATTATLYKTRKKVSVRLFKRVKCHSLIELL